MLHYLIIAAVAFVGYSVWSRLDLYFREKKFRKSHGTEKPFTRPKNLPFGFDFLYVIIHVCDTISARMESQCWKLITDTDNIAIQTPGST